MTQRLKILSIASACPFPPHGGTRILIYQQVHELARHHDLDLVAVDWMAEPSFDPAVPLGASGLAFCRRVHLVELPERERRFSPAEKMLLTATKRAPFFLYQRYSANAQQLIDDLVARENYDVIVAEDNEAGLYVRPHHAPKKVLTKHSILSFQRDQLASIEPDPRRRMMDRLYASLLRAYEKREGPRFDLIKLPTADDLRTWRNICPTGAVEVITNGVDLNYFTYAERTGTVDRLLFTGVFTGAPNIDAALSFADEIYPRVVREIGPLPTFLVGKSPPPNLRERAAASGITVTGTVPDVRPYFGRKGIAVVPLRVASGIINKVIEPMAMGYAVVATPAATAGLEIDAHRVCMVAETPDEFARAIVHLVRETDLYERLSRAAREYVTTHHDWGRLLTRYRESVERLVAQPGASSRGIAATHSGRHAATAEAAAAL